MRWNFLSLWRRWCLGDWYHDTYQSIQAHSIHEITSIVTELAGNVCERAEILAPRPRKWKCWFTLLAARKLSHHLQNDELRPRINFLPPRLWYQKQYSDLKAHLTSQARSPRLWYPEKLFNLKNPHLLLKNQTTTSFTIRLLHPYTMARTG